VKFLIVFWLALVSAPLYGDDPPPPEPRIVDLNVVAVDNHGRPITDLTRGDFRVSDSGKPQAIAFFRHRNSGPVRAPVLEPNEYSNRGGANVPHATLILFDLLNERFDTRGVTANELVHSLQSIETADFVYLYLLTLDGRLYAVRGLEGPPVPNSAESPWTGQAKPLLDQAMKTVLQNRPIDIDDAVRTQLTYMALNRIAVELAQVPGRKSLVWLTDGVPIELGPERSDTGDWVDFTPLLRQLSEGFDRSGVSIYPVRTIMLGSPNNVDLDGISRGDGMASIDTLAQFAQMTGGRADTGKDIAGALRQAISDARTSYEVGYYPPEQSWDNKFHKIGVTCTRKGVRIQTKTGYYAWRDTPGARAELAIGSAISTTFDAAEIGLRAKLSPDPKVGNAMSLDAHIDARDVVLVHEGDLYDAQLRVAIVGYVPGVQPQPGPPIPLDLHFSAQERDKALQQGIGFVRSVALPEDAKAVRLIVFDRGSNAIGSVTMPVPAGAPGKPN
jgi:VWFA-related protein